VGSPNIRRSSSLASRNSRKSWRSIRHVKSFLVETHQVVPPIPELHATPYHSRAALGRTETRARPPSLNLANQNISRPGHTNVNIGRHNGPPIVYITPPGSPRRELIHGLGSTASVHTSDSDPLSEYMRKRFRIINPDPEPDLFAPYTYTPPPLPSTSAGSPYSSQLAPPSLRHLPASNFNALATNPHSLALPNQPGGGIPRHVDDGPDSNDNFSHGAPDPDGGSEYDTDSNTGGTSIWKKPPFDLSISPESAKSRVNQSDLNRRSSSRVSRSSWWKGKSSSRASVQQNEQDMIWATRPPPETVYHRLQEFFPDHDVDKVVIDVGEADPSIPEDINNARKQRIKKSIRMVAEEQVNRNIQLGSRRTKLWDSNVEELRM
jgi:hypothetical protein